MMLTTRKLFSLLMVATIAFTAAAQTPVLCVDLSVTDQITITASGAPSLVTISGSDTTGLYLDGIFGAAGAAMTDTLVPGGDLTSAANIPDGPDLFRGGTGAELGLNVWSWTGDATADFTAGSAAFSGSATWDIDAGTYADLLSGATSGDVWFPADTLDDLVDPAMVIGSYEVTTDCPVVPEPSAYSLIAFGLVGLGLMRRRS